MTEPDFIIVGAGSAGCVLAEQLSADPSTRVLLLEAGGEDRHPFIHMPRGMAKVNSDPSQVWRWQTDPLGDTPAEIWLRGKVLGGSSSVNGMMYFRGQPQDYDEWERLGAQGWGWSDMKRAFSAIEDHELGESSGGVGGPVKISQNGSHSEINRRFIEAGEQMGFPVVASPDAQQEGIGYATWTINGGRRASTARAFLRRARLRPNLRVETGVLVDRVLFDERRAAGVRAHRDGKLVEYRTDGEILLCAGGLVSPLILQRSGIGDPSLLKELGVEIIQPRRAVGKHMLEHRLLMMEYALNQPLSDNPQFRGLRLGLNALRYVLTRSGPMARGSYEVAAFVRSRPGLDRPDAEILMAPFSWGLRQGGKVAVGQNHAIHMFGYPLRSRSEGSIVIRSSDPTTPPIIQPNYLDDPYDRQVTVDMFRMIRRWIAQPAIAPLIAHEGRPGLGIESDEQIIAAFKRNGSAGYHACGTARMGSDEDAVLDAQLRVNGVANLRVIDGSIMPTMVSANTNGPIMAIGWRASELIRNRQRNTIIA